MQNTTVRNLVTSAWRIDVTSIDRHALRSETVNSLDHTALCKGKSLLSPYIIFPNIVGAEKEKINAASVSFKRERL